MVLALGCGGSGGYETTHSGTSSGAAGSSQGSTQTELARTRGDGTKASAQTDAGHPSLGIPNERWLSARLVTGGQPSDGALEAAQKAGFDTVISLRTEGESGAAGEAQKVEDRGMEFVSIPVAGAEDVTEENARKLSEALTEREGERVLLHCGSGNRVGALLALEAFHVEGKSTEEAMRIGKDAGLTRLASVVEEHFSVYCDAHAGAEQC